MINPKFEPSFWGYNYALPLLAGDKRCWNVTGALPTLAGLVPEGHEVTLLDENIEPIDFERLRDYDVIGLTGMIVQRDRMLEILTALKGHAGTIAVGGPYVSVQPGAFEGHCDVRFLGEADETWPEFLNALAEGGPMQSIYQQAERTDMTRVPPPRYDLLKARHYVSAAVQFSRGCPYECEFCDIITIFGRRPRMKTSAQVIAELDRVRAAGFRYCFLVDDNFIGNKARAKELLRELGSWQRRHGYPLVLNTEATINLADDPEMIELMIEANLLQVFTGIESPRRASLKETQKHQNIQGDDLLSKIARLRDGGLVISAGFIVGFDNDDSEIFEEQFQFVQRAGLAQAIVAVLCPIPTTPLYDRLAAEGRLDFTDSDITFQPKQMTREELRRGHRELRLRLFDPSAYFGRLLDGYRGSDKFRRRRALLAASSGSHGGWRNRTMRTLAALGTAARLSREILKQGRLRSLGAAYARYFRENRALGAEAIPFHSFVMICVMHWHYYNMVRHRRNTDFGVTRPESQNFVAIQTNAQIRATPSFPRGSTLQTGTSPGCGLRGDGAISASAVHRPRAR